MPAVLTDEELADLRRARYLLERPSFASRLTKTLGKTIEGIFNQLPLGWNRAIHRASGSALSKATRIATWTMLNRKGKASTEGAHHDLRRTGRFFGIGNLDVGITSVHHFNAEIHRRYCEKRRTFVEGSGYKNVLLGGVCI